MSLPPSNRRSLLIRLSSISTVLTTGAVLSACAGGSDGDSPIERSICFN